MTSHRFQESATIYRFPVGGRAGLSKRDETASPFVQMQKAPAIDAACGGSWYHEEAVREAEPVRN